MWFRLAFARFNLPELLTLNRFATDRFVLILGISKSEKMA
jgi:hypothetical protein